ncbi:hypothetical protein Tco_0251559 [Tanacetum coccineum]
MAYPCHNFTKTSMMRRLNTPYLEDFIRRIERRLMNILEYYNRGAYSKLPNIPAKFTTIEESKDLSSLALEELIGNLKVHEVVMKKNFKIYKGKKERVKSIALKAKKESSDDETSTSRSDDEEMLWLCDDPNHLIGDCLKPSRNKDQKAFIGGSWSDSENDAEDKTNDETCLMAQSSNKNGNTGVLLYSPYAQVTENDIKRDV